MNYDTETFSGAILLYLDSCLADGQSKTTVDGKSSSLRFFVRFCKGIGVASPQEVTKAVAEEYKRYLPHYISPMTGKALDIATIRNRVIAVKTLFTWLSDLEVFELNPLSKLKLPKAPKKLPSNFLSIESMEAVMRETHRYGIKGLRDRAALELLYGSAVRRNELANLNISQIDFKKMSIYISKGKGMRDRYVPIAKRTCDWITAYLNHSRIHLLKPDSGDALILNDAGQRYAGPRLSDLAKKYLRRAGFDIPAACNVFRHTAATLMLEGGADIREIQVYLGHADISTTQVYVHVSNVQLKKVYIKTHPAATLDISVVNIELDDYGIK